jgi:hypothetical protein
VTTKGAIFTGAALFVAYSLFRKSQAAGDLFYFPDKVYSFKFDGLTPVMVIGLRVQNTSNQRFNIYSFAANVTSNGYIVGNAYSFTPQSVAANSESIVLVTLRMFTISLVNDLINAFETKNFTQTITVKGQMNVDNLQVPVTLDYKIGQGS